VQGDNVEFGVHACCDSYRDGTSPMLFLIEADRGGSFQIMTIYIYMYKFQFLRKTFNYQCTSIVSFFGMFAKLYPVFRHRGLHAH
jgi:hypothetical protein